MVLSIIALFVVGIGREMLEDALPNAGFGPAVETAMDIGGSPKRSGRSRQGMPTQ